MDKPHIRDGQGIEGVLQDSLRGLAHSILVTLDGGTNLSARGRVAWLTDEEGQVIGEGLHEYLPDHFPD